VFDDEFIENLPDEPVLALQAVTDRFVSEVEALNVADLGEKRSSILQGFSLIKNLADKIEGMEIAFPKLSGSGDSWKIRIANFCVNLQDQIYDLVITEGSAKLDQRYGAKFNQGFCYEFSQDDIDRSQTLITELRAEISNSNFFEENHRQRLLLRLEKLQSELHKKMPDIDRIWGLVGDAGVVLGKFGKDAKPLVDRFKELAQIGWKNQARAEELPPDCGNPFLGIDDNSEP